MFAHYTTQQDNYSYFYSHQALIELFNAVFVSPLTDMEEADSESHEQPAEDKLIRDVIQDWDESLKGEHDVLIDLLKVYMNAVDSYTNENLFLSFTGFSRHLTLQQREQVYAYCLQNKDKAIGEQAFAYEMLSRRETLSAILNERNEQNYHQLSVLPDEIWQSEVGPRLDFPTLHAAARACCFFRDKAFAIRDDSVRKMVGKDYRAGGVVVSIDDGHIPNFDRVMRIGPNAFLGLTSNVIYVVKVNHSSQDASYSLEAVTALSYLALDGKDNRSRPMVAISPNEIAIAQGQQIQIWDWQANKRVTIINHTAVIYALAMSPKGELVYGDESGVCFYDLKNHLTIHTISTHNICWAQSMLISEDEKIILNCVGWHNEMQIYTKDGKLVYHKDFVCEDAGHDDASGEYELFTSSVLSEVQGCLLDNNRLAVFRGYQIAILDLTNCEEITTLQFPYADKMPISMIAALPSSGGKLLIEKGKRCYLFDAAAGKLYPLDDLHGNEYNLSCVTPLDNGDILMFSYASGTFVCCYPTLADRLTVEKTQEVSRPKLKC